MTGSSNLGLTSLVIPAFDEGGLLRRTVRGVVADLEPPYQVVLSVSGEANGTRQVAAELCDRHPEVELVGSRRRLGKGEAITLGLGRCRGDLLGFMDADGPFAVRDVNRMAALVRDGQADCVIASKWLGQRYGQVTCYTLTRKKLASRGLNLLTRGLFGLPFADTQGGAKLFTRAALERSGQACRCPGFDFDVELLWRMRRQGLRVKELHLPCFTHKPSSFRALDAVRMLGNLARLRVLG